MSKLWDKSTLPDIIYSFFPKIYRRKDAETGYTLKKYIQALCEGGYAPTLEEINNLTTLLDPDKITPDFLPTMFSSYGMEILHGIPEQYLRKLLPYVSKLYSMKGTYTAITYLTSLISGVQSSIRISETFNEDYSLSVVLEMDYSSTSSDFPDQDQLLEIIRKFVPFFCSVVVVFKYNFKDSTKITINDHVATWGIIDLRDDSYSISLSETTIGTDLDYNAESDNGGVIMSSGDFNCVLGDGSCLTNSDSLLLNTFASYDIITKDGVETAIFHSN